MQSYLQEFVDGCEFTRMKQDVRSKNKSFAHIVAQYPMQLVAIDLFEYEGFNHFTSIDVYSGLPLTELILASKSIPDVEMAYKMMLGQFGEPEFVLSDRGGEFNFLPEDRLRTFG